MRCSLSVTMMCLLMGLCLLPAGAQQSGNSQAGNSNAGNSNAGDSHAGHDHAANAPHHDRAHAPRAGGKDESNLDYLWRKSDEAFHAGDYERAIGLHRAIVALDPGDVESYSAASWLLWSMGKSDEALAFLQVGLKANPENWEMWDTAGQQYSLMKRLPEAKEAHAKAVQLIPKEEDSQMLRRRLAHAAEEAGDLKMSVEAWRGLVKDYPAEPVNKNNLARVEKLVAQAEAKQASLNWGWRVATMGAVTLLTLALGVPVMKKRQV